MTEGMTTLAGVAIIIFVTFVRLFKSNTMRRISGKVAYSLEDGLKCQFLDGDFRDETRIRRQIVSLKTASLEWWSEFYNNRKIVQILDQTHRRISESHR